MHNWGEVAQALGAAGLVSARFADDLRRFAAQSEGHRAGEHAAQGALCAAAAVMAGFDGFQETHRLAQGVESALRSKAKRSEPEAVDVVPERVEKTDLGVAGLVKSFNQVGDGLAVAFLGSQGPPVWPYSEDFA